MLLLLAACAEAEPAPSAADPSAIPTTEPAEATAPTPAPTAIEDLEDGESGVAWRLLADVEDTLPDRSMAQAVTGPEALEEVWYDYGFAGDVPDVDFADRFVLLLAQPDDACLDELVGLEIVDGALQVDWLPPPGGCEEPLIHRLHAVDVHRGHVPSAFTVAAEEPFTEDLEQVTIELPPYEGQAPPTPAPPRRMADADLDRVFKASDVPRCAPRDSRLGEPEIDGPLSEDPEVAESQRQRADMGFPSDEASTREALGNPADEPMHEVYEVYEAPVTQEEVAAERARSELADRATTVLQDAGLDPARDFTTLIDRFGRYSEERGVHVFVGEDAVSRVRRILDRELSEGAVTVEYNGFDPGEQRKVQENLSPMFEGGRDGPGSVTSTSGSIGPVVIGMVDPTQEALDRIAKLVDPSRVCVEPQLSGVTAPSRDG
jgi:hypothetical protein